jgi:ASC-1-like (ASCH) protein
MRVEKHVSEPWFSQIAASVKRVEGRLCKGEFASLSKNDTIVWVNEDFGFKRTVRTKVTFVKKYTTFRKYLQTEGLDATLPAHGVNTIAKGIKVYRCFFDERMEQEHGVLAIGIVRT